MKISDLKPARQVMAGDYERDTQYRAEWDRTAFARSVALSLVAYRREHDLTQAALARQIGTVQSVIARIEAGDQPPSLQTLAKLTAGTGLEFDMHVADGRVELAAA